MKRILSLLVAMIMALGCVGITAMAEEMVAKVGNTEYATIDEAIAAWTNGTTLTLLADVTLSDVIKLSSTEYHILDLGTYTMTAAKNKDAIQYLVNGRSSASYALDIKADATNPGGITATGKTIVSHIMPSSGAPSKDRPITRFYGGVFNASYVVKQGATNSWGFMTSGYTGASAPGFQFYGGEFNGTIYTNRSQNQFHGGTFNGSMQMSVDSSAYTLVAGGTFKNLSNSMGSSLNSDKFTIGSSKGANNGSVCIDEKGNYVITTTTPAEAEASVASNYNSSNYFYYSTVNTNGMYYEDVYDALEGNKTGVVTVFADEINLSDTTFKGTIVVPEGEKITIIVEEDTKPTWTVSEGANVTYTDDEGNALEKNDEDGSFVKPDTGETNADVIVEGVNVEIAPVDGVSNSYEITLAEGETWTDGESVTMTFPAVEGAVDGDFAYVVHEHEGVSYIYVGKVADGSVTITNTVGFSIFTVYDGDLADALTAASAMTGDVTVEIYDKVTLNKNLSGSFSSINFVGMADDAEIYLDVQGYIEASGKDVSFTDLTLSKSAGSFVDNAGFMNVAFGVYSADTVTYTNCTFTNGACASSGENTFYNCTFYRSHDKYGLWAYGDVEVVVDDCTFDDYRGIKMYAEGAAKTVDLTVKNTDFSAVTDKPAIVLTYGESVTLENNTYSSTGVFELDLDGAPNGTPVTSNVAPTCKNDNGACGVLVDGKIYTTVAQAAEVAEEGSTVVLLHDSTETVEFAEGVILDKNGFTAENVTVAKAGLSGSGTQEDPYKIGTSEELFLFASKVNDGTYKGVYAELTADIDLEQEDWTSIGTSSNPFTGTFDGKNFTISNVWSYERGLFGFTGYGNYVDGPKEGRATIKNLTINGVEVYNQTTSAVGGVVGQAGQNTEISGVTVTGYVQVWGYGYVGGIVGQGYVHIDDCHVIGVNSEDGDISEINAAYWAVGGIVGHAGSEGGSSITNCSVENVKVYSAIYGAGAIAGVGTDGPIENVSAQKVTIEAQSTPGANGYLVGCNYEKITGNSTVSDVTLTVAGEKCVGADVVAMVGEDCYFNFADAMTAAQDGDTVKLVRDAALTDTLIYNKTGNITIDGNGKTITLADGFTNTNDWAAAIVLGNTGAGDDVNRAYNYTIKNVVFDGVTGKSLIRAEGVTLTMDGCTVKNCNMTDGKGGLIRLESTTSNIVNTSFINNVSTSGYAIITQNYNSDNSESDMNIGNCVFSGNSVNAPGVVHVDTGDVAAIKSTEFIGNTVATNGNAAVAYMGWGNGQEVSGCTFERNTVTTSHATTKRFASAIFCDGCVVKDNAFINNTATRNGETISTVVAVGAYYGEANISANYWNNGSKPVDGADYTVEYTNQTVTNDSYYATRNEDGTLTDLVSTKVVLPNAEVSVLEPITLEAGSYMTWPSGETTIDRPLEIVMNFKANDTLEECLAGGFSNWLVDFNLKFTGLENGSITADNCYLAGNYGTFGWIVIPADGMVLEDGVTYPVVAAYDATLKYKDICESVKDFTAAIHVDQAILDANPNFKVELSLVMTNPNDADDKLTIGEPAVYTAADLKNETVVAKIGDKKYSSLDAAIEAANAGDTITLLDNISLTETVTVPAGKTITLDLNGKTVSGNANKNEQSLLYVCNTAKLTVKDSGTDGKITIAPGTSDIGYVVDLEGELILESGTIEMTGSWSIGFAVDVRPNAWGTPYTGKTSFVMNGGKIVSSDGAVRVASSSSEKYSDIVASFTMNNGEIEAAYDGVFVQQSNAAWDVLEFTINNGTIRAGKYPVRFYGPAATSYVNGEDCVDIALNGGTLTYTGTEEREWLVDKMLILGGGVTVDQFLKDSTVTASASFAEANVAEGYVWVESNGTYTLEKAPEVEKFKLHSMNIDLEGALVTNFYVKASDLKGEDYYAKIVHSSQSGEIEEIINFAQWTDKDGFKSFSYSGLVAKNMADKITVTIFNNNDVAVSEPVETSLSKYALSYIKANVSDNMTAYQSAWVKAFVDMLNYGAEAQKYFDYNESNLANAGTTDYQDYATKEDIVLVSDAVVKDAVHSSNLDLEDRIVYNAYFKDVTEDMHAEVSFTNHVGKEITETIPNSDIVLNKGLYQVSVKSLVVADAGQPITIVIKDDAGNVHASLTESVNGYLARIIPYDSVFAPLGKAMAKFTTSVREALHTKK